MTELSEGLIKKICYSVVENKGNYSIVAKECGLSWYLVKKTYLQNKDKYNYSELVNDTLQFTSPITTPLIGLEKDYFSECEEIYKMIEVNNGIF